MNLSLPVHEGLRGAIKVKPALPAVFADLGHLCVGDCRAAGEELNADVWFTRSSTTHEARQSLALVVIDTTNYRGSLTRRLQLLHHLNDCTRPDGIHVTERRHGDAGHALAAAAVIISSAQLMTRRDQPGTALPPCLRDSDYLSGWA